MPADQLYQTRSRSGGGPYRLHWSLLSGGSGTSGSADDHIGHFRTDRTVTCSLLALKSIMGLNLLAFAHGRQAGMDKREQEDRINDFGRKPIGESLQEQVSLFQSVGPSMNCSLIRLMSIRNTMIRLKNTYRERRTTCQSSTRTRGKMLGNLEEVVGESRNGD
jgi:hypothetical protein